MKSQHGKVRIRATAGRWWAFAIASVLTDCACSARGGATDEAAAMAHGGAAGQGGAVGQGGAAGQGAGAGGTGAMRVDGGSEVRTDCGDWACWPMPNPADSGLPNPAKYDTSDPNVVIDEVTGLMWQRVASAQEMSRTDAAGVCEGLELGSYTGWRLPTLIELVSLIDHASDAPGGSVKTIEEFSDAGPSFFFWSSTASGTWGASLSGGHVNTPSDFGTGRVRCVRTHATRATATQHYVETGVGSEAVVLDAWTGLAWQATATGPEHSFDGARAYCTDLTLDGGGWRVPSVRELLTLVDRASDAELMIDQNVFHGSERFTWSSSLDALTDGNAWFLNLQLGTVRNFLVGVELLEQPFSVRCVR